MAKTIFLVRHGESVLNAGKHYTDESAPLTEKGREQAQFIAKRISHLPVDVLISSTMERAKETAAFISTEINMPIEFTDVVVERRYPSILVGMEKDSVDGKKIMRAWNDSCYGDSPKVLDGDDFDDLKLRASQTIELLEGRSEKNILVVTHGSFMKFICMYAIYGESLSSLHMKQLVYGMRVNNTGLTVLHYDPKDGYKPWWLSVWNDHAHLADVNNSE